MIKSYLIKNQTISDASRYELCKFTGIPLGCIEIGFLVFKIKFKLKTFYACWSGGKVFDEKPMLSPMGTWALEALSRLKAGDCDKLYMREMKLGATPLKKKTFDFLKTLPNGANICFFGDMSGELDGYLFPLFNIQPKKIEI
jgi:hypothetical protein